jgi:class 3 adenylate cyclase
MVRQLRLVIEAKGHGREWLALIAPPRVIHYLGHIISAPGKPGRFPAEQEPAVKAAIERMLAEEDVGFGYGSLAAGADILFAEALLARKAQLHVVLPFDREEFIEVSVRPSGDNWVERFEQCFRAAETSGTVRFATEDRYLGDDHLFGYCSQLAMGLARLRAQHLSTGIKQIVVWDGNAPSGPAGTAVDTARWQRAGLPRREIIVGNGFRPADSATRSPGRIGRRVGAMLFSDIHGFSGLGDEQLPRFVDVILRCCAEVIARNRPEIRFVNTWGDGLFLVFDDAGKAAECALELQEAVGRIDLPAQGLPADMGLRVGLHLGPIYAARDPILDRENFFGAHVSRAARVEPVTPEGCIYVTETVAAVLALHHSDAFACEYVGMTEAAKHYGAMRMFLLSRRPM